MAHFAELDQNNVVLRVVVVHNDYDDEARGVDFCQKIMGGTWKKTSYNSIGGAHKLGGVPYRKNYAGVGYVYDKARDAFIAPQPYPSWTLNEKTCIWEPPVPQPDGKFFWNEKTLDWE